MKQFDSQAMGHEASLTRRLVLWVLAALFVVWAGFVVVGYQTGIHETGELSDGHLVGTAAMLVNLDLPVSVDASRETAKPVIPELDSHDYQPSLSVMVWDVSGRLLTHSGEAPDPAFQSQAGFANLELGSPQERWRSFSHWDKAHSRQVMVLVRAQENQDTARDVATHLAQPSLFLLPIVALALGAAVWRGLRPLQALSRDVANLDVDKASRLQARHPYREFNAVVRSINHLIGQQQAALERERQLASEIAHELRTPLASISLQAASLRGQLSPQAHEQALAQIGADSMRAGHVIHQLLALARASRSDLRQQRVMLELPALARKVVADYAQPAWKSGHQLSVQGDDAMQLLAHPLLVELALRNLVENALQHTRPGSSVCVQWGRDADEVWLQVCDDGLSGRVDEPPSAAPERLGLGHKIVGRVMEIHGGSFDHLPADPPFTHRYRLGFAIPLEPET